MTNVGHISRVLIRYRAFRLPSELKFDLKSRAQGEFPADSASFTTKRTASVHAVRPLEDSPDIRFGNHVTPEPLHVGAPLLRYSFELVPRLLMCRGCSSRWLPNMQLIAYYLGASYGVFSMCHSGGASKLFQRVLLNAKTVGARKCCEWHFRDET